MTTKWLNRLMLAANLALMAVAVFYVATRGLEPTPGTWNYADLVTIVLTATTVILGAVALGVALLAIWGYRAIAERAEEIAGRQADEVVNRRLNEYLSDESVKGKLSLIVGEHVRKEADSLAEDFASYPLGPQGGKDAT